MPAMVRCRQLCKRSLGLLPSVEHLRRGCDELFFVQTVLFVQVMCVEELEEVVNVYQGTQQHRCQTNMHI